MDEGGFFQSKFMTFLKICFYLEDNCFTALCWFQVLGHFETETGLLNAHAQVSVPQPPEAPEDRGPGDAHMVVGSREGLSLGKHPRSPAASPWWPGQGTVCGRCPPRRLSAGRTTVFGEGGMPSGTQMLWVLDAFLRVVWLTVWPPLQTNKSGGDPGWELIQQRSACDLFLRPGPFQPKFRSGMKLRDVLCNFPPGLTLSACRAHSAPAPPAGPQRADGNTDGSQPKPHAHPPLPPLPATSGRGTWGPQGRPPGRSATASCKPGQTHGWSQQ